MPYAYARGDNCYGRGDYYQGDYYRGDPGLFGSLKKALLGGVKGFITGGPLGAIGGAVGGLTKGGAVQGAQQLASLPPAQRDIGIRIGGPSGFQFGAFGPDIPQQPVGTMTPQGFVAGCQLKGTRPNKSSYFRAVPGQPGVGVLIPKGSVCVKPRRLNVANPRALRRAIRRAQGFAKLSRRVLSFVSAKAPKGRPKFRRKR